MLRQSFLFLDKIGRGLEQHIWDQGVADWHHFLASSHVKGISKQRKKYYDRKIKEAARALHADNAEYFADKFPSVEHWRLYDQFKEQAVYLDIETTGLGRHAHLTVLGLFDGTNTVIMVKDKNLDLDMVRKSLRQYKLMVTFNGSSFDVPFLNKRYPNLTPMVPHVDLRHVCARVGLTGGLKEIEKKLDIQRAGLVDKIAGGDAMLLWRMYKGSGDPYYLKLLVEYNEEDICNLQPLAEYACAKLKQHMTGTT